jgi:hypothetical protein
LAQTAAELKAVAMAHQQARNGGEPEVIDPSRGKVVNATFVKGIASDAVLSTLQTTRRNKSNVYVYELVTTGSAI